MLRSYSTLKNTHLEIKLFQQRVFLMAALVCLCISLIFLRLAWLQIHLHKMYMTMSQSNQFNLVPIEPNRGLIYDRNGVLLAENVPAFSLNIVPDRVSNLKTTISELGKLVPLSQEDINQFRRAMNQRRRFEPIPIRLKLNDEEVARFSVDQYRFPGVIVKAQLVRHYPQGSAMVPALGYVGRINETELEQVDSSNYSASNYIGKLGIEKYYENTLHGTVGYEQIETDANGREVRVLKRDLPIPGENLYITIDSKLQNAAVDALGTQRGAVVAIDPNNGEVLALVSSPSYDPNLFVNGINNKDFKALREAPDQPLYNRAIRGQYPPGSTVKPFIALEALGTNTVSTSFTIFDPGWFQLENSSHRYRDWKKTGHGIVNLHTAIIESCDTYFFTIAQKLGIARIDEALSRFGFGSLTGLDTGEEISGILPTPQWKRLIHNRPWYPGDTLITTIGQGFMLATPIQLAHAVATLSMRGQRYTPHFLLRTQRVNGTPQIFKPKVLESVEMDDSTWDEILNAMYDDVADPRGTAHKFSKDLTYTMAAKTGTAQVFSLKQNEKYHSDIIPERLRDHWLFIAFAPVDKPRIAIAVLVENSSEAAGEVARKVLDAALAPPKPLADNTSPNTVNINLSNHSNSRPTQTSSSTNPSIIHSDTIDTTHSPIAASSDKKLVTPT